MVDTCICFYYFYILPLAQFSQHLAYFHFEFPIDFPSSILGSRRLHNIFAVPLGVCLTWFRGRFFHSLPIKLFHSHQHSWWFYSAFFVTRFIFRINIRVCSAKTFYIGTPCLNIYFQRWRTTLYHIHICLTPYKCN